MIAFLAEEAEFAIISTLGCMSNAGRVGAPDVIRMASLPYSEWLKPSKAIPASSTSPYKPSSRDTTSNSAAKVRQTQLQYNLPIIFGHDPGKDQPHGRPQTMIHFRTGGTPWHILIDPRGRVVFDGFSLDTDAAIAHVRSAQA